MTESELAASEVSLDELACRHGTDKSSRAHGFTTVYERLLEPRRRDPITVLEIGVHEGASLRMWRDYFSAGRVVGIDKVSKSDGDLGERVSIYKGSQTDRKFLETVASAEGPFDLIVDDGGHWATQQKTSLRVLWPHVSPGGCYAVEDIHTSYLPRYGMGWRRPETTVELLKSVVDDVNVRFHNHPVVLPDVASMHVYQALCVITRLQR